MNFCKKSNLKFRRDPELRDRKSNWDWDRVLPSIFIACFFFYLQARHLHLAAFPFTDEGVYAEAGRLMLEGLVPHKDFPLWHLPLLPLYSGIVLKLTGNMYWVRLLFLALNCFAVVPFYLTCKKLRNNSSAAILAILFYLTFHELMFQDFRFLAIRQMANNLLILFVYLGVCQKQWKWTPIAQSFLFGASLLLFLPNLLHFSFLALAMSYSETRFQRLQQLKKYFFIAIPAILILVIYFAIVPRSLDQVVFGQINREATGRFDRLLVILQAKKDIYLYILGCLGLIYTYIWQRKLRFYALATIGLVLTSTFLSANFYPHYMSAAAPAFAFGIFGLGVGINEFCQRFLMNVVTANFVSLFIYILLFSYQFSTTFPSLYEQWTNNRTPSYYQTIAALAQTPAPLLTMEPIFAVEAGKKMVRTPIEIYFRAPGIDFPNPDIADKFSQKDFQAMAAEACTIFLEGKGEQVFPIELQKQWQQEFQTFQKTRWGVILSTNNPGCSQLSVVSYQLS